MWIERKSTISGKITKLDIDITLDQLDRINNRFETKELIQRIVPDLPADQREFLISGITPEEWKSEFGDINDFEEDENAGQVCYSCCVHTVANRGDLCSSCSEAAAERV